LPLYVFCDYTIGVIFYALDYARNWCRGVWHLFVLAGSVSHYFAILRQEEHRPLSASVSAEVSKDGSTAG